MTAVSCVPYVYGNVMVPCLCHNFLTWSASDPGNIIGETMLACFYPEVQVIISAQPHCLVTLTETGIECINIFIQKIPDIKQGDGMARNMIKTKDESANSIDTGPHEFCLTKIGQKR